MSRTNSSARASSAGVTPGVPLRSIGFEGSYGRGPGTVVGVGAEVRGVVVRGGASVGEVPIGFGTGDGDPSSGTRAVPEAVGDEPAADDAVGRVVVCVAPRFAAEVVDDRFVDGADEVVNDGSPGDRVVGDVALTRFAPPEHETAIIVKAKTPTIVQALRTAGYAMAGAYANR